MATFLGWVEGGGWPGSGAWYPVSPSLYVEYVFTSMGVYCRERGIIFMATSKSRSGKAVPKKRVAPTESKQEDRVALTLKVDSKTYVRLCTLGATQRRTNQDILREAVQQYLDRVKA